MSDERRTMFMGTPVMTRDSNDAGCDYVMLEDAQLLGQCEVDVYRASGPGGQKRNKVESAVRLRHKPTGVMTTAEESRSQHENKARALRRLRLAIALHVRRQVQPDTYQPSALLRSCISGASQLIVGRRDRRYDSAVWEILDCLHACSVQLSTTARLLGVSTANLSKFLRDEPAVWRRVNEMRKAAGAAPLK